MRSFRVPQVKRRKQWMTKYTVAICAHPNVTYDIATVHDEMAKDFLKWKSRTWDPYSTAAEELHELLGQTATHDALKGICARMVNVCQEMIKSPEGDFLRCDSSGDYPKIQKLRLKMLETTRAICEKFTNHTGQQWSDQMLWKVVYAVLRKCALSEPPLTLPAYTVLLLAAIWQNDDQCDAQLLSDVVKKATSLGMNSVEVSGGSIVDALLSATEIRYSAVHLEDSCSGYHSIFLVPCKSANGNNIVVANIKPLAYQPSDNATVIFVRGFLPFRVQYTKNAWTWYDSPTGAGHIMLYEEESNKLFDAIVDRGLQEFPPEYAIRQGGCKRFDKCKKNVSFQQSSTLSASE